MLPNNIVLSSLYLSDKEEIDPAYAGGNLHPRLAFFGILLRHTFLLAFVEDSWARFLFPSPSDLLSLPANWDRALVTSVLIIFFISLLSVLLVLFGFN